MFELFVAIGLALVVYGLFHISKQLESLSRNQAAIGNHLDQIKTMISK